MKRIVLCFDGTWNDSEGSPDRGKLPSNVVRFYESVLGEEIRPRQRNSVKLPNVRTLKWYDEGVGAAWGEKVRGAFGYGLSRNIMEAYHALVRNYSPGDEIYTLGFSRGAYSARSLAGLIRKTGVLRTEFAKDPDPADNPRIEEAYKLYRRRDRDADAADVMAFRREFSYAESSPEICVVGVWDTVGALGLPTDLFRRGPLGIIGAALDHIKDDVYGFHDTRLSRYVTNAFHALAIDEHREAYAPTLWTDVAPGRNVQQLWFAGCHCDVGGGYENHALADISLRWMQECCELGGRGLEFNALAQFPGEEQLRQCKPVDSYHRFLDGKYAKLHKPLYRAIPRENVHESAWQLKKLTSYSPPQLA